MKILLQTNLLKYIKNSGVGRAIIHQKKALELNNVDYTLDKNDDFDIIHINTIFPSSVKSAKKARKQGKKVIMHAHSTAEDFKNSFLFSNLMSPFFKKWLIYCYKQANLIVTPTPYSKALLENYNLNKPIVAISNGIELDYFKPEENWNKDFRDEFNFTKEDKIIMGVGLYIERKGILEFVELAKRLPEYKFIWFGYTNLNTVPKKIKRAVNTKLDNLIFPGYYPREKLRKAFNGANLFLFPTYEETEGIVILEALASKIPVLVRDIPIYKDWLIENKDVYKGKDINHLENKITDILENKLPNLTKEGYDKVSNLSIENIGLQLKTTYEQLLNDKETK